MLDGRRLISLSMVKNEPFIRHHADSCDAMIVLDNSSVDATREIILSCARELGNVVLTDDDTQAYGQATRMTRMLEACQVGFHADLILLLDADKFIWPRRRTDLLAAFARIPSGGAALIPWRTFVVAPGEADAEADPPRTIRWRRRLERLAYWKAIDGAYRPDLAIEQGNHALTSKLGQVPTVHLDGAMLLQFPVRSARQITAKRVVGLDGLSRAHPERQGGEARLSVVRCVRPYRERFATGRLPKLCRHRPAPMDERLSCCRGRHCPRLHFEQ